MDGEKLRHDAAFFCLEHERKTHRYLAVGRIFD